MGSSPDLTRAQWHRSSYSGSSGGECVEVADLRPGVGVRDSKNPEAGILTVSPEAYADFVTYVSAS
ncbi:protein of unknown function [Streptomyces sp. Ag82_O1-12]|uniref:DUF397 domain-containing protein n=1 Tax=unclassified Streptomyces TaxID=2593676 RepID=UPI000BD54CF0|nr:MULTISPECIES: DUF397 domain-containing protein [unclassified Streptomyces]SMQ17680.1 protein of unknown function [Streptomyces sp. Ag82_O1-12]SOD46716.1 protein of unknown function [Streptomyces sp. Ag82_G6-1]